MACLSYFMIVQVPFCFLVYSLKIVLAISCAIPLQVYLLFYLLDCENTPYLMLPILTEYG